MSLLIRESLSRIKGNDSRLTQEIVHKSPNRAYWRAYGPCSSARQHPRNDRTKIRIGAVANNGIIAQEAATAATTHEPEDPRGPKTDEIVMIGIAGGESPPEIHLTKRQ